MTAINASFPSISHAQKKFSFEHLVPTSISLADRDPRGTRINVRISYQTHVFSKRYEEDPAAFTLRDETGRLRQFCQDRYTISLGLPGVCKRMIEENYLTWVSQDRNRASNLAVAGPVLLSGSNDLVVYYLFPSRSKEHDVELVVKSAYNKEINFDYIKRRFNVCQLIKKAHFQNRRVP